MKKVACYVRVSTENQIENYSIDEQTERLKAYCQAKDYSIYKFYTDGGYSGGNTNRPALQNMLKDVSAHKVDAVLVYKLDRLSRSQKDTLSLIEDSFLANGTDFISMSENFDTSSPFGRAMIGILSVFAQLEKDQITERFTMGRIGRSKAGLFHGGGNAPKGYDYIDGKLVVNFSEAKQIQEIYRLFLSGKSVNAIYRIMDKKYPAGIWHNSAQILACLKNSIYIGKVKFKGVEYDGIHEALIPEEQFYEVQNLLQSGERENSKTNAQKNPFRAEYLLSGLLFCGHCGARYCANHGYYRCYSRAKPSRRFIKDPNCKNKHWQIPELDKLITDEIYNMAVDQKYKKVIKFSDETEKNDKDKAQSEINKIDSQINKLIDLYQVSDIPISTIKQKVQVLNDKKANLQKIIVLPQKNRLKEFEDALNKFIEVGRDENVPLDEKRLIISGLIERIVIDEDEVNIVWRI